MVTSNLFKRMISSGSISVNNGELNIWNVPSMIYPIITPIFFQMLLEKKLCNEIHDILYDVGKMQGREGGEIMYSKFGFKRNKKSAELGNEQGEFVGIGHQEYLKFDIKNKHFIVKIKNTPFSKQYLKLFGRQKYPVDHFIRGLLTGANEAFSQTELIGIETECIAQEKPHCIFEITPKKDWNLKDPLIKQQFPKEILNNYILKEKTMLKAWQKPQ